MDEPRHDSHRTAATVPHEEVAQRIVIDLSEQGIAPDRVHTRPAGGTGSASRSTGEQDMGFTESAGKTMGAGWLIGALIGAVVGAIGVSILYAPPWESGVAAAITLGVALGVGYLAGGLGFLQAGIARAGERGGEPLTRQDPGHAESDRGLEGGGDAVEVIVDAVSPEEARVARTVFEAHDGTLTNGA